MNVNRESATLPRLIYAGDVPVEASVGGSLLLYRLLLDYPPERLHILESSLHGSEPTRRLPGANYGQFRGGRLRLLRTRLRGWYSAWLTMTAGLLAAPLVHAAQAFRAEAILTVSHGYGWLAAAAAARTLGLPLHLIAHDDWLATLPLPRLSMGMAARLFRRVYCRAASRLCVSPAMEARYREECGVAGEVLYPSRGPEPERDAGPSSRPPEDGFVLGYAGSIHDREYLERLTAAAEILRPLGGRVRVFSPSVGVTGGPDNLEFPGPLPAGEVVRQLRESCDALLVPMSFQTCHAANMRLCFPSKVADYTATGLPLLIWGPAYSSANVWAREEGGGWAEVVESPEPAAAAVALHRLASDPAHRQRLSARAAERGQRCFSHGAATRQFFDALRRAAPSSA